MQSTEINDDEFNNICDEISSRLVDEIYRLANLASSEKLTVGSLQINILLFMVTKVVINTTYFNGQAVNENNKNQVRANAFESFVEHIKAMLRLNGGIDE